MTMDRDAVRASYPKSRLLGYASSAADKIFPLRTTDGNWCKKTRPLILKVLEKAVAEERESCAKILDRLAEKWNGSGGHVFAEAAAEIRARKN
jgi:hypothetical protein